MASISFLPALLAMDPLQLVPDNGLLHHSPNSPSDLFILPQAEPPVQILLLFAKLLAAVAVDRSTIFANAAGAADRGESEESLHIALTSRQGQLTSFSPVLLTDLIPHDETGSPQPLAPPSRRVILLRSLVLFLKLATLTFNVKADRNSGQKVDSDMHPSVQALWHVTFFTAAEFLDQITDVKPDNTLT